MIRLIIPLFLFICSSSVLPDCTIIITVHTELLINPFLISRQMYMWFKIFRRFPTLLADEIEEVEDKSIT